ncbi:kinase-like domain-containing protein [Xylaria arbuscula]|nr:kinase-like domain-containing protein [Xylaria arbuscula]
MAFQRQAKKLAQEIEVLFETSSYWEYEKLLGYGGFGVAILLRQKGESEADKQRMALKVALPPAAEDLRTEIEWLKKLHGSKHIVQILASCDRPSRLDWDKNLQVTEEQPLPPQTAFGSLAQLEGPVVALEYIENGDLLTFFRRMTIDDVHMPNRMLWSLFLCLIRACVGMAYPIGSPIGTAPVLETHPTDGRPPQGITHNDIAIRNIMVATGDDLGEHHIGHLFKLIDFGQTNDFDGPRLGPPRNLLAVARLVAFMIKMADINMRQTKIYRGSSTYVGEILPQYYGNPYPWLDPDLAGLIAECMYEDVNRRPTLKQVLDRAGDGVMNKRARSFPEPGEETDDAIREFVQRYILDP